MYAKDQIFKAYRHDLASFIRFAFKTLYPCKNYVHNWHIDVVADHLERYARGEIKHLIINMPPRSLKSFCVSVAFSAWILGKYPDKESIFIHCSTELRNELEELVHALVTHPRYRAVFPGIELQPSRRDLMTTHGGSRKATTMANDLTGRGADSLIIDDPLAASQALDVKARRKVNQYYDTTIYQRLNHKANGQTLLVMQRLHLDDLTGHILRKRDDYVVLSLRAIATEDERWELSNGRVFERKKGEALHPALESREQLMQCMRTIGAFQFLMQYQQADCQGTQSPFRTSRTAYIPMHKNPEQLFGFVRVPEVDILYYELFGVGEYHPLFVAANDLYSDAEWEQIAIAQQQRLLAESGL